MKTVSKAIKMIAVILATGVLFLAPSIDRHTEPGDSAHRVTIAIFTFLSVALLDSLLSRYVTGADLVGAVERQRVLSYAASGYHRSALRGIVGLGYMCILAYCFDLTGVHHYSAPTASLGLFLTGIVFLLVGSAARARGVVFHLLHPSGETSPNA